MTDPLWRKAPLFLLRYPSLAVAVLVAAVVLGLTGAAGTLFIASVHSAALDAELTALSTEDAGLTVGTYGVVDPERFAAADQAIRDQAGLIPELGEPTVQLRATPTIRLVTDAGQVRFQLLSRTGALDKVEIVSRGSEPGVWVPEGLADHLRLDAGDTATVAFGDRTERIPVEAVYRNLLAGPLDPYWRPLAGMILPRDTATGTETPPPLVLIDETLYLTLGHRLDDNSRMAWQFPLEAAELTPSQASALTARYASVERRALDREDPFAQVLDELSRFRFEINVSSALPGAVAASEAAMTRVAGPARAVTLAGQAVALVVLAAAAAFRMQRRSVEARLLVAQGVGAGAQAGRAVVELAPIVVLGGLIGWGLAVAFVPAIGPSRLIDAEFAASAGIGVAVAAFAGLLVAALTTGVAVLRHTQPRVLRLGAAAGRLHWEVLAVVLAGVSYWQLTTRGVATDGVDLLLVGFPLLFLAGMAGFAVRALRRVQPALRRTGGGLPPPLFLALRRTAGAGSGALLLIAATMLATGVLAYAGSLVSSARTTVDAKATTLLGARSVATLARVDDVPPDLPDGVTTAGRLRFTRLLPGDLPVEVLAVRDPFGPAALREPGEALPALLAGQPVTGELILRTARARLPVELIGTVDAFPGMGTAERTLVVDLDRLRADAAAAAGGPGEGVLMRAEVWADLPPEELTSLLTERGAAMSGMSTADDIRARADVQTVAWTFSYLQVFGVLAGLLALVGTVLYLQARQQAREISYALARRMGLTSAGHRLAVGAELGGILIAGGLGGGALGMVAARAVLHPIDPLPDVAPGPLFSVPWPVLLGAALAAIAAALAGAWWVQRTADRARIAEVLRVAG